MGGESNPQYVDTYVFKNDFAALIQDVDVEESNEGLLNSLAEKGTSRVICFSPDHSLTMPEMPVQDLVKVVQVWKSQFDELGAIDYINNVQILRIKVRLWVVVTPIHMVRSGLRAAFQIRL